MIDMGRFPLEKGESGANFNLMSFGKRKQDKKGKKKEKGQQAMSDTDGSRLGVMHSSGPPP